MLLTSRITRPQPAAAALDRPRLYRQLDRWQEARAVLIHAPAGYGKSSLASRWLEVSGHAPQAAWLALEEDDCDPRQLVRDLARALDTLLPGLLDAMQPVLADPQGGSRRALTKLLAALWDAMAPADGAPPGHRLLVVDDLHLLPAPVAASILTPLLEEGPPSLHLLLLSRRTPSLPLTRLYAGGQVVELTATDLRFTADEVGEYLAAHGVSPSAAELDQIVRRTEGWAIALQLALLSRRGNGPLGAYLAALRGDSRWLAQYLTQEVLARQSPTLRNFLLRTAILDSFSAPLCEAVTGVDNAYQLLAELRDNELFLIPVDAGDVWFRYHHLFQELLERRLLEVEGKAAVANLHRRAAQWLARQELLLPAIRHLLAAGDEDTAAALVESRMRAAILQSPLLAQRLFDALPAEVARRRPRLMLERCLHATIMSYKDLAFYIQNAQRALAENPPPPPLGEACAAELLVYRAAAHLGEGDMSSAAAQVAEAQRHSGALDPLLGGALEFVWMHIRMAAGDEAAAHRHARRAMAAFKAVNFVTGLISVRRELALLEVRAGRSAEAGREFDRIAASLASDPVTPPAELLTVYYNAAEHCYWQNQLDRALHYQQAALALARSVQDDEMMRCLPYLYHLYAQKLHRLPAGEEPGTSLDLPAHYGYADWQIRWLLAADRIDEAWEVAREYQARLPDDLKNLTYRRALPYLRAYIARGVALEEADSLISHALEASLAARDLPRQLELLALRAWRELQGGREDAARRTLAQAEELVAKTGYVRVLLDIPALAARLPRGRAGEKVVLASQAGAGNLLTEQEQAVLALLANERTYPEIARELVVSVNTVRTHVRHIYRKLAVHRREQALAAAQRRGLLSR